MSLFSNKPKHTCPRRTETGMDDTTSPLVGAGTNLDTWQTRDQGGPQQCSWCGSLHPDYFMEQLAAGNPLEPTTKDYKAYLNSRKFYYQHLTTEQRHELIRRLNAREITFQEMDGITFDFRQSPLPYFIKVGQ
jgi:hypothetical protein